MAAQSGEAASWVPVTLSSEVLGSFGGGQGTGTLCIRSGLGVRPRSNVPHALVPLASVSRPGGSWPKDVPSSQDSCSLPVPGVVEFLVLFHQAC